MRIGARTHDLGKFSVLQLPGLLKEKEIQTAQLVMHKGLTEFKSYDTVDDVLIYEIRDSFYKAGVDIDVLGCYMDLGNPKDEVREEAIATFIRCLHYGKEIGAKVVGTETAYPHLSEEEKSTWRPYMWDSINRLVEQAEKIGQDMAIEPVYWHPLDSFEMTAEVFRQIKSPRLKMIFDPANVMEDTSIDQNAYYRQWLEHFGQVIEVIHMKDFVINETGNYQPVALGSGVMNYHEIVKWSKANKPDIAVVREELEQQHIKEDIAYMKRLWD